MVHINAVRFLSTVVLRGMASLTCTKEYDNQRFVKLTTSDVAVSYVGAVCTSQYLTNAAQLSLHLLELLPY